MGLKTTNDMHELPNDALWRLVLHINNIHSVVHLKLPASISHFLLDCGEQCCFSLGHH